MGGGENSEEGEKDGKGEKLNSWQDLNFRKSQ